MNITRRRATSPTCIWSTPSSHPTNGFQQNKSKIYITKRKLGTNKHTHTHTRTPNHIYVDTYIRKKHKVTFYNSTLPNLEAERLLPRVLRTKTIKERKNYISNLQNSIIYISLKRPMKNIYKKMLTSKTSDSDHHFFLG